MVTVFFQIAFKDMKRTENRILLLLMVFHSYTLISDIASILVMQEFDRYGKLICDFWNYSYLVTQSLVVITFLVYVLCAMGIQQTIKRMQWIIFILPTVFNLMVLAINPFTGVYYYYNEANAYTYGPLKQVLFFTTTFQLMIAAYYVIRYRKRLKTKMFIAIISFYLFVITAMIMQQLFPHILFGLYAEGLALLALTLAVENKDEIRALLEANDALKEERERADAANRYKSDFLANMSHEIRTPINAVLGMNEMILRESRETATLSYAENVERAGRSLLAIINDILDFSKIESGRMEIVNAPYRLSSVLNDVSNMILFRAREKNLSFDVFVDEGLPDNLYGDEVRVRQIMTNLLNNAVKYTKAGSVKLTVEETYVVGKENEVELIIMVEDTGMGIRREDMNKLFGKFERMDQEKNKTVEGTGLGLAITKNLVEMMDGSIHVESEYGEGSLFTVCLPQAVISPEPIGNFRGTLHKTTREKGAYRETFHAPDAHVLVVDDTELNLTVICGLLKETKLQITTAGSGAEAVALAEKTPFDLILMDQRMPGMDGVEAQMKIRVQANGCNCKTPIICLTADAVQGARERYLAEGFTDYLTKPVEIMSLEAALMEHLPQEKMIRIKKEVSERYENGQGKDSGATASSSTGITAGTDAGREQESPSDSKAERFVREKTPELLASLKVLANDLKPFFEKLEEADADLPEMEQDELEELYESIRELCEVYDLDGINHLMLQMQGYRVPEMEQERYAMIKKCIQSSDWNMLKEVLPIADGCQ